MSVQTRALIRMAKHLTAFVCGAALFYLLATFIPTNVFVTILCLFTIPFIAYQIFKIYVTIEELEESNKD